MQFLCREKTKLKVNQIAVKHVLLIVSNYTYLGVDFSYNRAWDTHIKKLIQNDKQKVSQLNSIISRGGDTKQKVERLTFMGCNCVRVSISARRVWWQAPPGYFLHIRSSEVHFDAFQEEQQ